MLAETGRKEQRKRLLPARVVVYFVLALALFYGDSYEEVMRKLAQGLSWLGAWKREWRVPTASALVQARERLGSEPLRDLFERAARPCALRSTAGAWLGGRRLMSIDGVELDAPDTPANAGYFGRKSGKNGAGQEHSDERPVVPISTLIELLDNVPERYRAALLLLATFANLRFGELAALRRDQLNLDACEVRVSASTWEMDDGRIIDGDPKSRAGTRTVAFPADIVPELDDHLKRFADPEPNGFVFIGPKGGRLRRSNFREIWYRARGAVGLPELHFHDLRHTGNTMAAAQGASLKELMERMGHSSPRAALVYLHATRERDQKIAAGMGRLFAEAKTKSTKRTGTDSKPSGTQRARRLRKMPTATREH